MKSIKLIVTLAGTTMLSACVSMPSSRVENVAGQSSVYQDVGSSSKLQGVGIESQDVVAMSDKMIRSMLSNPMISGRSSPPRVLIDSDGFKNESTSVINLNMLTMRLESELTRVSNGRMIFVDRQNLEAINKEREIKREGLVDGGTIRKTKATAGVDYRMFGTITSLDAIDRHSQMRERYHQIIFKMVDMELGTTVWSDIFEMKKSAQDNIMYR
jgi:PBP1b-binding outer membrane lipoprotein LpoB